MKVYEDKNYIAIYFNSIKEYVEQLFDQDLEILSSEIKRRPDFACVKSYAELLTKMNYDEKFVQTYGKIKADIYMASKKSVATVKQWRDGGSYFSYSRYLEGRPCVWKGKRVEYEGGKQSRTVPVFINLSEPWYSTKEELTYKALATAEMVKAIQSQGRNVELYLADLSARPTFGRYDTLTVIKVKGGADPLVIPRLLSAISPYFYRCYLLLAQKKFLRYKGFTPNRSNIMKKGHGHVRSIAQNKEAFARLIRALGIEGVDSAIIIDSEEVTSQGDLEKFRRKHGITLH